jgi:hypothetical protein
MSMPYKGRGQWVPFVSDESFSIRSIPVVMFPH